MSTKAVHLMRLDPGPFEQICARRKLIECRLYDEKRRKIGLGDLVVFRNAARAWETVEARVVGLLRYPTFEALTCDLHPVLFGFEAREALLEDLNRQFEAEEQQKGGVVGIRIELLK